MTLHEAVALALYGATRRRILGAIVRTLCGRPIPDLDDLPPRLPEESLLAWASRCDGAADPGSDAAALARRADRMLDEARSRGQSAVVLGQPDYPPLLAEIPDPPPVLWLRGSSEMLRWPRMVALVGARAATPGGLGAGGAPGSRPRRGWGGGREWLGAWHRQRGPSGGPRPRWRQHRGARVEPRPPVPRRAPRPGRGTHRAGRARQRARAGHAAPAVPFPAPQPHHQRPLGGSGRRRGLREERVAHHGDGRAPSRAAR